MFTLGSPLSGNLDKRLKGPKSVGRKAVQETMATVQVKGNNELKNSMSGTEWWKGENDQEIYVDSKSVRFREQFVDNEDKKMTSKVFLVLCLQWCVNHSKQYRRKSSFQCYCLG